MQSKEELLAYVIGVALGDGNLSNPNGRAVRLRITCDNQYPNIISEISNSLKTLFPNNKVSCKKRNLNNCTDISVYSNELINIIPWKTNRGSKIDQNAHVPAWIKSNTKFSIACLRGLFQTDGSIYYDRQYLMVNFTNQIESLANDVQDMITELKYCSHLYVTTQRNGKQKFVVRLSKNTQNFINCIRLYKS